MPERSSWAARALEVAGRQLMDEVRGTTCTCPPSWAPALGPAADCPVHGGDALFWRGEAVELADRGAWPAGGL